MKTLDRGSDKIQKICDQLRVETLEPAKKESAQIIAEAEKKKEQILHEARLEAEMYLKDARAQISQERSVFQSSLAQASRQGLEALRQSIEKDLFNDQLFSSLEKQVSDPQVIAKILDAIVTAISKEGLSTDFAAIIPKTISAEDLAKNLAEAVFKKLQKHPFVLSDFQGGVQVKLIDKKMTIDMSDATLRELLSNYVRKDFRHLIFGE